MPRNWVVTGGNEKGGLLVREGPELSSLSFSERLEPGAVVEEIALIGYRLHFLRQFGTGPREGWISVRAKDKVLAEPIPTKVSATQPPRNPCESPRDLTVVSLGYWCYTKMALCELGLSAETLPFDWIQTRMEGILHYLKHDFRDFMAYSTKEIRDFGTDGRGAQYVFRDRLHSFWHDDPEETDVVIKYQRRIARFSALDSTRQPILFVRSVVQSQEVYRMEDLLSELKSQFGEHAHLLVILDMQRKNQGPVVFTHQPNLMLYLLSPPSPFVKKGTWYVKPVQCAIDWIRGDRSQVLPCMENVSSLNIDPWDNSMSVVRSFD